MVVSVNSMPPIEFVIRTPRWIAAVPSPPMLTLRTEVPPAKDMFELYGLAVVPKG